MTVTSEDNITIQHGNGVSDTFNFTFPIFEGTNLEVYVYDNTQTSVTASDLLTITTDYTVTISTTTEGGSVTCVALPTADEDILIKRVLPYTQETDIGINVNFPETDIENEFDKSRMIDIQLKESLEKCIKISDVYTGAADFTLPTPEASTVVGWDSTGLAMANYTSTDLDQALVTTFGESLVTSSTALVARGVLELDTTDDVEFNDITANDVELEDILISKKLNLSPNSVTIASGAVAYTGANMTLDTQAAAATDDLDTISGGTTGDIVYIRIYANARNVVIKHGTGNIFNPNETDTIIDKTTDTVKLIFRGEHWAIDTKQPIKCALLTHQVSSGTNGGSSTGASWQTRPLTTEVYDYGSIVSLATNQFTLQPGTYKISANQVIISHNGAGNIDSASRIRNITTGATVAIGMPATKDINTAYIPLNNPVPDTIVGIEVATVFELQYWTSTGLSTTGLGDNAGTGEDNVFAFVYIETLN